MPSTPQIILTPKGEELVLLPRAEYEALKSEAAGAMVCAGVLTLALSTTVARISPFFNIELLTNLDAAERLARLVQNRIGYVILTLAVMLLTFGRAEQRERLLSG